MTGRAACTRLALRARQALQTSRPHHAWRAVLARRTADARRPGFTLGTRQALRSEFARLTRRTTGTRHPRITLGTGQALRTSRASGAGSTRVALETRST